MLRAAKARQGVGDPGVPAAHVMAALPMIAIYLTPRLAGSANQRKAESGTG